MVRHAQTNRRQQPTNCLSVLDHFVGWRLKRLRASKFHLYCNLPLQLLVLNILKEMCY